MGDSRDRTDRDFYIHRLESYKPEEKTPKELVEQSSIENKEPQEESSIKHQRLESYKPEEKTPKELLEQSSIENKEPQEESSIKHQKKSFTHKKYNDSTKVFNNQITTQLKIIFQAILAVYRFSSYFVFFIFILIFLASIFNNPSSQQKSFNDAVSELSELNRKHNKKSIYPSKLSSTDSLEIIERWSQAKKEAFSDKYRSESLDKLTNGIALQKINEELEFIKSNRIAYKDIIQEPVSSPISLNQAGDTVVFRIKTLEKYNIYSLETREVRKIERNDVVEYILKYESDGWKINDYYHSTSKVPVFVEPQIQKSSSFVEPQM